MSPFNGMCGPSSIQYNTIKCNVPYMYIVENFCNLAVIYNLKRAKIKLHKNYISENCALRGTCGGLLDIRRRYAERDNENIGR